MTVLLLYTWFMIKLLYLQSRCIVTVYTIMATWKPQAVLHITGLKLLSFRVIYWYSGRNKMWNLCETGLVKFESWLQGWSKFFIVWTETKLCVILDKNPTTFLSWFNNARLGIFGKTSSKSYMRIYLWCTQRDKTAVGFLPYSPWSWWWAVNDFQVHSDDYFTTWC